jgi:hypothetical protein
MPNIHHESPPRRPTLCARLLFSAPLGAPGVSALVAPVKFFPWALLLASLRANFASICLFAPFEGQL